MLSSFPYAIPLHGLLGGAMIGLAAALMLLGAGRIAGVSGLAARALSLTKGDTPSAMAIAFIAGLPLGALLLALLAGPIEARFPSSPGLLAVGGLLVGFGTRLGSGCTSGHGVCGMARFSRRSIAATATFIASGVATVAVADGLGWGWQ
jgi:uncharacterized membrane protein YedE/YeeE